MIIILIRWYACKLVYRHDLINSNESFHFFDIGGKVPPFLLGIEVALLNKWFNQNIRINDLFHRYQKLRHLCQNSRNAGKYCVSMWLGNPLFLYFLSVCDPFINNMRICFSYRNTRIIWIVIKFHLFSNF